MGVLLFLKVSEKGVQAVFNLFGESLSQGIKSVLPDIIMKRSYGVLTSMISSSFSMSLFEWATDYFGLWEI